MRETVGGRDARLTRQLRRLVYVVGVVRALASGGTDAPNRSPERGQQGGDVETARICDHLEIAGSERHHRRQVVAATLLHVVRVRRGQSPGLGIGEIGQLDDDFPALIGQDPVERAPEELVGGDAQ